MEFLEKNLETIIWINKIKYYKKHYKNLCGDYPKNFEIHHIDFDRKNNDIQNLVALPKSLHKFYHKALYDFQHPVTNFRIKTTGLMKGNEYNYTIIKNMEVLNDIIHECNKWVDYRDFLLGIIPNIHIQGTSY